MATSCRFDVTTASGKPASLRRSSMGTVPSNSLIMSSCTSALYSRYTRHSSSCTAGSSVKSHIWVLRGCPTLAMRRSSEIASRSTVRAV